jgi:hypothetical protein
VLLVLDFPELVLPVLAQQGLLELLVLLVQ